MCSRGSTMGTTCMLLKTNSGVPLFGIQVSGQRRQARTSARSCGRGVSSLSMGRARFLTMAPAKRGGLVRGGLVHACDPLLSTGDHPGDRAVSGMLDQ
jgi:hypothetical protein